MKTNREQGNALIYVLIAIALFAALSMTLGRQTDTNEASNLSDEKAELYATQLINYAAQAKSAVDQMIFSGINIDALDFILPGRPGFDTGTIADKIKRVYHPDGGGLTPGTLAPEAQGNYASSPAAGWYMGRFNNVDWTKTTDRDVILTAYGINPKVCSKINQKVIGDAAIPTLGGSMPYEIFVDTLFHAQGNGDLVSDPSGSPECVGCYRRSSLCIYHGGENVYLFYTVLADQ